jgi:hypothetical protein
MDTEAICTLSHDAGHVRWCSDSDDSCNEKVDAVREDEAFLIAWRDYVHTFKELVDHEAATSLLSLRYGSSSDGLDCIWWSKPTAGGDKTCEDGTGS